MADKEVQQSKNATVSGGKKVASTPKLSENTHEPSNCQSAKTPAKTPAKKAPQQKESVDKEVLLILREMNAKLNAQDARLQKQEEKIDAFASMNKENVESYDYYGDEYVDYDPNEGDIQDYQDVQDSVSCVSTRSAGVESDKKSVYKTVAEKITQKEIVDNEVNDDLAAFVNSSFRDGLSKDKMDEMLRDIHRPQNCDSLVKTKVNQGIWRLLRSSTHYDDDRMQTIQDNIVKASSNFVKLIDKASDKLDNEDMEWGMHGIALLGNANKLINNRRKDLHKLDLDPKYYHLASSTMPYTDRLYGDDGDVNKNIRDINDMSRIGRTIGRGYVSYSRGLFRGRRPHPYSRAGAPRGRGRPRAGFPKNLRVVPKK